LIALPEVITVTGGSNASAISTGQGEETLRQTRDSQEPVDVPCPRFFLKEDYNRKLFGSKLSKLRCQFQLNNAVVSAFSGLAQIYKAKCWFNRQFSWSHVLVIKYCVVYPDKDNCKNNNC